VKLADLIVSLIRADIPLREIDPYRRAGADAYDLIDDTEPASWARLAAWNAFLLQVYGDNLVAFGSKGRYMVADAAMLARRIYVLTNVWLEEVRKAQVSATYAYRFDLPYPLPHSAFRTDELLRAMRRTLDTGRTRVASDLLRFVGEDAHRDLLRVRLAEIDSEAHYVDRLWTSKRTEELSGHIGETLEDALDHTYEIGQLLAQPALILRLYR